MLRTMRKAHALCCGAVTLVLLGAAAPAGLGDVKARGVKAGYDAEKVTWALAAVPFGTQPLPVCGARASVTLQRTGSRRALATKRWTFDACHGIRRWKGVFRIRLRPGDYVVQGEITQRTGDGERSSGYGVTFTVS